MTALSDWDCLIVARMHGVDFFIDFSGGTSTPPKNVGFFLFNLLDKLESVL